MSQIVACDPPPPHTHLMNWIFIVFIFSDYCCIVIFALVFKRITYNPYCKNLNVFRVKRLFSQQHIPSKNGGLNLDPCFSDVKSIPHLFTACCAVQLRSILWPTGDMQHCNMASFHQHLLFMEL